jgi:hypothetical protein
VLSEPNALLHPDPRQRIAMTNFGQTHGTEERRVIVDLLRLPYLKNELVIQIELGLSAMVRRELLSTTRDRLKRGARYTALIDAIIDALGDDPELQAGNTRRRLQLLDRQQKSDYTKLRRRFAELIEKFAPGDEAAAKRGAGNGAVTAPGGASEGRALRAIRCRPLRIRRFCASHAATNRSRSSAAAAASCGWNPTHPTATSRCTKTRASWWSIRRSRASPSCARRISAPAARV